MPSARERAAGLTALGGFSVWQVDGSGLVPLAEALQPVALRSRCAATRAGLAESTGVPLAEVPDRTAVSAAQFGLVARFWSVALASVALHDLVPDLSVDQVLVAPSHRNPAPMAVRDPDAGARLGPGAGPDGVAAALADLVLGGAVTALTQACHTHGSTPERVLVSNAAAALVSSSRVLGIQLPARRPLLEDTARLLLEDPRLAAGGGFAPDPDRFRRTGCCLYYRLPGHGLCADCVLVPASP